MSGALDWFWCAFNLSIASYQLRVKAYLSPRGKRKPDRRPSGSGEVFPPLGIVSDPRCLYGGSKADALRSGREMEK